MTFDRQEAEKHRDFDPDNPYQAARAKQHFNAALDEIDDLKMWIQEQQEQASMSPEKQKALDLLDKQIKSADADIVYFTNEIRFVDDFERNVLHAEKQMTHMHRQLLQDVFNLVENIPDS